MQGFSSHLWKDAREYAPLFRTMACFLAVVLLAELVLEVRATRRGWDTIFFGPAAHGSSSAASQPAVYGPSRDFPFRSRIVPAEKKPGMVRVWIASSSHSAATNLPPDEIFADLVATGPTQGDCVIEVLNAGKDGYTIGSSILELKRIGAVWKPDIILFYDMINDINSLANLYCASHDTVVTQPGPSGGPAPTRRRSDEFTRLLQTSTTFGLIREHISSRFAHERVLYDSLPPAARRRFVRDLDELVATARSLGAQPVLCTFATAFTPADAGRFPAHIRNPLFRFNIHLSESGWINTISALNDSIRARASLPGNALVDVAGAITGRSDCFVDMSHLSAEGHGIVAGLISTSLAPSLAALDCGARP
jgi:hypothetical protein